MKFKVRDTEIENKNRKIMYNNDDKTLRRNDKVSKKENKNE
jgi:hypothetical protein